MAGGCPQEQLHRCFQSWINQQAKDLNELDQAVREDRRNEERLKTLAEKNIKHFQEYHEKRFLLVKEDPPSSFSPTWCTPFENSFLWIAGCRPTLAIQLVYTLCGSELEAHLTEFLEGVRSGNLGELSSVQLGLIDELHCKIVREEEEISNRLERLQEYIGEQQLALVTDESTQQVCNESIEEMSRAIDAHAVELARIWEEADRLRLNTMKELIVILTPLQAVDFLVAAKKLYLSMHEWGQNRIDSNPEHFVSNPHEFNLI
ncbi:Transcription factor TGA like domain [Macleaya cordata]|uniref:Transcription factor TGA like domain n=1 Tax=Macleaya cordata TaxID=56857 RepID=A0A200PV56_MACCD|nr:Transcription factor TGA like domain [Macleaya cordata]